MERSASLTPHHEQLNHEHCEEIRALRGHAGVKGRRRQRLVSRHEGSAADQREREEIRQDREAREGTEEHYIGTIQVGRSGGVVRTAYTTSARA